MRTDKKMRIAIFLVAVFFASEVFATAVSANDGPGGDAAGFGQAITGDFFSWRVNGFKGYKSGSAQLDQGGLISYSENGQTFTGKVVAGNIYNYGYQDRATEQLNDGRTAYHRTYQFGGEVVIYTTDIPSNIFGSLSSGSTTERQFYFYKQCKNSLVWWERPKPYNYDGQSGNMKYSYLSMPGDWRSRAESHVMSGSIELGIYLNPSVQFQQAFTQSYNSADGTFTLNNTWAGIMKANGGFGDKDKSSHGFVSSGSAIITGYTSSPTNPTADSGTTTGSGSGTGAPSASGVGSDQISAAVQKVGGYDPWKITVVPGPPEEVGKISDRAFTGQPVPLMSETSVQLADKFTWGLMAGNNVRNKATMFVPIQLRPRVTVYSSTYSWNDYNIQSDFCILYYGTNAQATSKSATAKVGVHVENVYVVQSVLFDVDVIATYQFKPRQTAIDPKDPDYRPPTTEGTFNRDQGNDTIFGGVTEQVTNFRGNVGGNLFDFLGGLEGILVILLVIVAVIAIVVVVRKIGGNKQRLVISGQAPASPQATYYGGQTPTEIALQQQNMQLMARLNEITQQLNRPQPASTFAPVSQPQQVTQQAPTAPPGWKIVGLNESTGKYVYEPE